jgi:hypothetical protein
MSKIISKYQRWYEALCAKARNRDIPTAYTEVHHIKPRSLGGSDDESNLVRLTYREHYLAHWLLTKFHTGPALRKMLKALGAMGMQVDGRSATGWQVEKAKQTIRDLELDDDAQIARDRRRRDKRNTERLALVEQQKAKEVKYWANMLEFAKCCSPEMRERIHARKAKRESELKSWGWYYDASCATEFEVISIT